MRQKPKNRRKKTEKSKEIKQTHVQVGQPNLQTHWAAAGQGPAVGAGRAHGSRDARPIVRWRRPAAGRGSDRAGSQSPEFAGPMRPPRAVQGTGGGAEGGTARERARAPPAGLCWARSALASRAEQRERPAVCTGLLCALPESQGRAEPPSGPPACAPWAPPLAALGGVSREETNVQQFGVQAPGCSRPPLLQRA